MSEGSNLSVKPDAGAEDFDKTVADSFVPQSSKPLAPPSACPLQSQGSMHSPAIRTALKFDRGSAFHMPYNHAPSTQHARDEHRPLTLPKFLEPGGCMWTASHAANCPSEDRSASLVNLLLQPLPPNFDSETQLMPLEPDYKTLIRLNLWCVIDGHGGGCVATYASEVLLPHIAVSVSRALGCAIVDRGVCTVNGQLRDANALDLDGLIKTSDRTLYNPNSIHYRSPYERSDSEEEDNVGDDDDVDGKNAPFIGTEDSVVPRCSGERKRVVSLRDARLSTPDSTTGTIVECAPMAPTINNGESIADATTSSVKTSVKTTVSPTNREALVGMHSPQEVASITRAITESFLAVDEGWINSIDPVATHQTSCQSNGRWNSGACALVVFTIQRLDWTNVSEPDKEKGSREPEKSRLNTAQNRDAARRRMLDYAARTRSASSVGTASSTSSLTTEEAVNVSGNISGVESEITETEGEEEDRDCEVTRHRQPLRRNTHRAEYREPDSLISPPGGCSCHCYRAHDAILYTAHVGDCRAVMLGSAPPRTIKVRDFYHHDTTDDESSHHSSDETECLSSSDHDADSSEDEEVLAADGNNPAATASSFMLPRRRVARQKLRRAIDDSSGPFIALPPLETSTSRRSMDFDFDRTEIARALCLKNMDGSDSSSESSSQGSYDILPLIHLPPVTRPIDLTTDHSAYNPAEVTAVLRRCNNAPRAISAGVGGGIKRVAGSLAVTRALGDAYLKTPLLSFLPYKSHAPYITARPEVNCRPLVKDGDKILILATDGVWERASGEDALRWVRNFYEERKAEAERRKNRRNNQFDKTSVDDVVELDPRNAHETADRYLFEKDAPVIVKKREGGPDVRSPSPPAKRRKRNRHNRIDYNVADVIVRRVLNKVRRARNISSLQTLMSLPQGRARRSKHDDITASVVDLSAFVS